MIDHAKILQSFKRSNKDRKLKLAQKAGFSTIEDYLNHLQENVEYNKDLDKAATPEETPKVKPTIHVADVIDCSGSMAGKKISNAIQGINSGIDKLKKDTKANYLYTLCDFSGFNDINFSTKAVAIEYAPRVTFRSRGMTALYDAIAATMTTIGNIKKDDEKVLINVFTDGIENNSREFSATQLSALIELGKSTGYTITFVGTEEDTASIISKLKLDESNTLSYDGSAEGLSKTMEATSIARSNYAAAVTDGLDVSKGFYKNINNK